MRRILLTLALVCAMVAAQAQTTVMFAEEITISDFAPTTVTMPPSPLTLQTVFVGGYDIVQTTATYGNPAGRAIAKEWHDFIGFTPDDSGESLGWVTVNHEQIYNDDRIGDGGGMTAFRISKDGDGNVVVMEQELADGRKGEFFNVDFVNTVGETGMNCAGISAPNGRIWTAEEWFRSSQSSIYNGVYRTPDRFDSWNPHNPATNPGGEGVRDTADFTVNAPEFPMIDGQTISKYENFNYMVEVDPKEAVAIRKQYNWGRAGWEGGAISNDGKYVYLGIDATPAPWVRAVAATPWDFTDVDVQVYKEDNAQGERWISIDMDLDNMLGGLTDAAWEVGATMFNRNEWVAIDTASGMVYWTETGRDGVVGRWADEASEFGVKPASHHETIAQATFGVDALNEGYMDYYGRVLYYDPATEEVGVTINGGPYLADGAEAADYPSKHLSNPDGLNVLHINGKSFLMIQEDLNGTSVGRMPNGVSNRLCELYLLDATAKDAPVDDLVRVTAIPAGAEITGAIQIDDNTVLVNSQHPNANNPFPFNHSLTMAIHGFANVTTSAFETPGAIELEELKIYPNPTTREIFLNEVTDFAIYNMNGQRLKVFRNTNQANVADLTPGTYLIVTAKKQSYKIVVQ
ncbi:MAG: alkaline phosphatase PhoX [Bacteroidota bacterium]